MDEMRTPLYDALNKFRKTNPLSFHVPGHKNGLYVPERGREHFHSILEIDKTELTGLDDLHDPTDCIYEAQQLLRYLYGTKQSYFLVNGSTVGNLAMILAVCSEGDRVLVQRNCHKSVMNGLQLAGAQPIFLPTYIHEQAHVPVGVAYETIQQAINMYPQVKAIILTHPNYYGMGTNLDSMISLAHEYDIPVLVDEAHGAHFCLGEPFPASAIAYGADVVVHSAHKTLPAMTMGSFLHINSNRVKESSITRYLHMLQSSSPSYPIMASLDLARYALARLKRSGTERLQCFLQRFKDILLSIPQIEVIEHTKQDPIKIIIQSRCTLSGYELQSVLEEKGIYAELSDFYNVLLILPLEENEQYMDAAYAMKAALQPYTVTEAAQPVTSAFSGESVSLPFSYKQLAAYDTAIVPVEESVGQIAAEMIIPYPPGIPLLITGEEITEEHIQSWRYLKEQGARFQQTASQHEGHMMIYRLKEKRI